MTSGEPDGQEADEVCVERTLFHLHLADGAWVKATADAPGLGPGRGVSDWPELVLAVADGVRRGWVTGASILGRGADHTMNYGMTRSGRRALATYRRRLQDYPVVDEPTSAQETPPQPNTPPNTSATTNTETP